MREREREIRRGWARGRLLGDAWSAGYPTSAIGTFARGVARWFRENRVSWGVLVVSAPLGPADETIGRRIGCFIADSPGRMIVIGSARLTRSDLLRLRRDRRSISVRVVGRLRITDDVDASLAERTLHSVRVTGVVRMSASVRERLAA